MIAAWMLYCVLCALGLSLAAVLAERALLLGRGPVRHVWIGAVLMSVLVPAAAYRYAPRATSTIADVRDGSALPPTTVLDSLATSPAGAASPSTTSTPRWNWRAALAEADTPLAIAWLTLSSVLVAHFLFGTIALSWMRRWWRRDTVQGVDVLVSEVTGPALVGALSPAIVVPEWTLAMDPSQVSLMLRHEQEHRRARDGQLLTAAHFALIAMPWNVALWWQLVRLRVAVELDCDARVLRDADARSYGDLLLEVARPRRRLMLMGATAFAERASQLERRIRAIGLRRGHASRRARLAVACIGVVVLSAAWVAPRPPAPVRTTSHQHEPAPIANPPQRDSSAAPVQRPAIVAARSVSTTISAGAVKKAPPSQPAAAKPDTVAHVAAPAPLAVAHDSTAPSTEPTLVQRVVQAADVRRPLATESPAQGVDSIYGRLFAGITLTPDQDAKVRLLINQLQAAQIEQMTNAVRAITAALPARQAIQAHADSALEGLLTSDADRALLRSRFASQTPGGRGRSGGGGGIVAAATPVGDSVFVGGGRGTRVGGAGGVAPAGFGAGGGRGGGGARGGGGRGVVTEVNVVDFLFGRFFDGIPLTPQQEADARIIISKMQADLSAIAPRPAPTVIRLRPFSNQVVMPPETADAFAAILSNDADRATLRSRIVVEVVRTIENPPR
jgi:hypothetical protein